MLEQPIYSLFIRMIPESFLVIYSICLLTNSKPDLKKIFISCIIGGTSVYITRLLPIHFGIHTILGILINVLLAIKIINIDTHKAIVGAMIAIILIYISDLMIFVLYVNILKIPPEVISAPSLLSVASSLPSLLIFFMLVKLIVSIRKKRVKHEQR